ncbi:MAG: DUF2231 domain-containing protein [Nitrospinaceae bacterium]
MVFAKLHPFLVHFPVGLFVSGVILDFYGRWQKEETAMAAGRFNVRFGFVCALITGSVGLLGLLGLRVPDAARTFVGFHFTGAAVTIVLFGTALVVDRWFSRKLTGRFIYMGLLVLGLGSVLATGYFGGELVHRFGLATAQPLN